MHLPESMQSQAMGAKQTRGRAPLSVAALLRQPRLSIMDAGFSDDEEEDASTTAATDASIFYDNNVDHINNVPFDTPENTMDSWAIAPHGIIESTVIGTSFVEADNRVLD